MVNNPELLEQVAKVYATTSGNANIAAAVIPLGFCKGNGTALDSANISRLKTVVMELNQ